jgi:anaerobic magnesium-protoporphyrin IX monomethyl ester cyclase
MLKSINRTGPIVLISVDIAFTFPFGYAYLAGYLMQSNETVIMKFRPDNVAKYKAFIKEIIDLKPLLVGIGTIYPDLYHAKELIAMFQDAGCQFPIVIGGQMVTPTPEFSVEVTGADYGVVGEGEIILNDLVKAVKRDEVPYELKGLVIRDEKNIKYRGPGEYIEDLSKLPEIPYELFPEDRWLYIGKFYAYYADYFLAPMYKYDDRIVPIHGGRGCPYTCNFCYHHSIPRYRPIPLMINEAEKLLVRYNANMVEFNDDLVIATPGRARELVEGMKALNVKLGRKIEYSISCRFNVIWKMDDALLTDLKNSGCRIMGIGLESGSQRILDIMHKKITVEQIVLGLRRLKAAGIIPIVAFMVGQLTETAVDVEVSIKLMKELIRNDKNFVTQFTITTPFPGSELYDVAFEKGLLKSHYDFFAKYNPSVDLGGVSVNLSSMDDSQVVFFRNEMERIYLEEKKKIVSPAILQIEGLRSSTKRIHQKIQDKISKFLPCLMLINAVSNIHDFIQVKLDQKRFRIIKSNQGRDNSMN